MIKGMYAKDINRWSENYDLYGVKNILKVNEKFSKNFELGNFSHKAKFKINSENIYVKLFHDFKAAYFIYNVTLSNCNETMQEKTLEALESHIKREIKEYNNFFIQSFYDWFKIDNLICDRTFSGNINFTELRNFSNQSLPDQSKNLIHLKHGDATEKSMTTTCITMLFGVIFPLVI
ncbi:hypothetical protein H311_04786, partial [Anncaliia algerae PRA109]